MRESRFNHRLILLGGAPQPLWLWSCRWYFLFLATTCTFPRAAVSSLIGGPGGGGGDNDDDDDDELFEYCPCEGEEEEGGGTCLVSAEDCYFREYCSAGTNCACTPDTDDRWDGYEGRSAAFKFDYLWNEVMETANTSAQFSSPTAGPVSSVIKPFITTGDVWSDGHRKLVHSAYGTVAQVEFVVDKAHDHPFTGILKSGSPYGILRFSSGSPFGLPGLGNYVVPGFAIKFLRGGMQSGNMFGIHYSHIVPLNSTAADFLRVNYTNHGKSAPDPNPEQLFFMRTLLSKFGQATFCPQFMGVSDLTIPKKRRKKKGRNNNNKKKGKEKRGRRNVFPFEVVLVPRLFGEDEYPFPPNIKPDTFIDVKRKFLPGTLLFNVYARSDPTADANIYLGDIISKSRFVASKFADERLLFRHTPFEQDLKEHPEWLDMFDWETDCFSPEVKLDLGGPTRLSPPWNASVVLPLTCPFAGIIP